MIVAIQVDRRPVALDTGDALGLCRSRLELLHVHA
jgi:hypothetical protein